MRVNQVILIKYRKIVERIPMTEDKFLYKIIFILSGLIKKIYYHISIYIVYILYTPAAAYMLLKYKKNIIDLDYLKDIFCGKKIAIVGPADTAYMYNNGSLIDSCDLVVRFNKSYTLVDPGDPDKTSKIGSKTDIIFHYFNINKNNEAILDTEKLSRQGLKQIITIMRDKRARSRRGRGIRVFMGKYGFYLRDKLCMLPEKIYSCYYNQLGSKPTIGHIGITAIIESIPASVFITGFSFFTTPYAGGYRDNTTREAQLKRFQQSDTGHDPAGELRYFADLVKNSEVKVTLDPYLQDLINNRK